MRITPKNRIHAMKCLIFLTVLAIVPSASRAQLVVDCTGSTPGAFTSINAALPSAGPGSAILVAGPCTEDVNVSGQTNLSLGAWWGQAATLKGKLSISSSQGVYVYGLNVSSATGDGINIQSSNSVTLDSCTSNGNAGSGLSASNADISIVAPSAFDNNAQGGITLGINASVVMSAWNGGAHDISNNAGHGLWESQASFYTFGPTTISNNTGGPAPNIGFGVVLLGGGKAQFGTCTGTNVIQGNQSGGITAQETAEVSLWNCGYQYQNIVQGNGPVGIAVGLGSQATLYDGVDISGHTGSGLDLYANSQAYLYGSNTIHNNGNSSDNRSAGIRLDGNSELLARGGNVVHNSGPAILALVNSSADFTGVSFASNTGGTIACDSSAFMVSDLAPGPAVICRVPHSLGNRSAWKNPPTAPDWSNQKARQAKYKSIATRK